MQGEITEEKSLLNEEKGLLNDEKECRNCHTSGGDDLIAPCACSGSIRYVHRSCLNSWRAVSPNPNSFAQCDVCKNQYVFNERPDLRASRVRRFVLFVARDFLGAMFFVQCIIALLGLAAWGIDHSGPTLRSVFPSSWPMLGVYYVWGLFFFSLLAAIYGFVLGMYWCCGDSSSSKNSDITYNTYPYSWGYYYIWCWNPAPAPGGYIGCCPACDCSHPCYCGQGCCACGGCPSCDSAKNSNSLGYVGMIILAIGVVIGFIVMVVIAAFIIRTHMRVLRKYQDAREMEVADLENQEGTTTSCAQMV